MILVHVSAPAAGDVAAGLVEKRQRLFISLRVPAVHGVQRHPVGALGQNGAAVYPDEEFPLVSGQQLVVDVNLPNADALPAHVHHLSVQQQFKFRVVQRRLAIAPGPPQPGLVDFNPGVAADKVQLLFHGSFADGDPGGKALQHGRVRLDAIPALNLRGFFADFPGDVIHLIDVSVFPGFQRNAPPHARRGKPGHDVPAEAVGRLALPYVILAAVVGGHEHRIILFPGHVHGGMNLHQQAVHPRLHRGGHVEFVGDEHVVRAAHLLAVDVHVRVGVQPFEDQHQPAFRQRLQFKFPLKAPGVEFIFPIIIQVLSVKGFLFHPRPVEIQFHVARHLGRNFRPGFRRGHMLRLQTIPQFPFPVQAQLHSFVLPSASPGSASSVPPSL